MRKVLLATLGEAPAVVTEAIDRLRAGGIAIDTVTVLTTKDTYVQGSLNLLNDHIPRYYNGEVEFWGAREISTFSDIDSDEACLEFMNEACAALRDYRKMGAEIYVCIAGGRKTMSALMALAVQFYGAHMLFHVLVDPEWDPEWEEKGHYLKIRNKPPEEQDSALHPPIEHIKLVRLPFLGLFPLLSDIVQGLKGEMTRREIREILEQNELVKGGNLTDTGRMVLSVLERVELLPEPRQGECEKRLSDSEPRMHRVTRQWADRIAQRFLFVRQIEDIGWREGQPKVRAEAPNVLVVYVPARQVQGMVFRLLTTARTQGQLERAQQEIERWLEREVRS